MESNVSNESNQMQPVVSTKRNKWVVFAVYFILILFVASLPVYIAPVFQTIGGNYAATALDSALLAEKKVQVVMDKMKSEIKVLDRKLDVFLPHLPYIVVNTTKNRFHLYDKDGKLVREGFCSSGSYTKLVSEKKTWVFKTPKGRMTVLSKTENPVWSKPDWAFIEEGLPVPPPGDPSRYERGVLGKYKLSMADGYLLHGTLYKRFLGMPVTHGCIRLGDEDLDVVYHTLNIGSYVYVY